MHYANPAVCAAGKRMSIPIARKNIFIAVCLSAGFEDLTDAKNSPIDINKGIGEANCTALRIPCKNIASVLPAYDAAKLLICEINVKYIAEGKTIFLLFFLSISINLFY